MKCHQKIAAFVRLITACLLAVSAVMPLKPTRAVAAYNPPNCVLVAPSPIASRTTQIYAALQFTFSS
jgi:hypothetical protein